MSISPQTKVLPKLVLCIYVGSIVSTGLTVHMGNFVLCVWMAVFVRQL